MNEYTRNEDRVYRYGGEKFAILFTNHNNHSTTDIMDRIIQEIEPLKIPHKQSEHRDVTISAGVCVSNEKTASIDKVMTLADERLYLAKNKGRNCLVYNLAI
jgi:diguanylate cyclase (GGDEF)-like protein